MRERTFENVRDELFRLYHAGDYAAAYELITREAPRLPERAGRMLYWRACLANKIGKRDESLAALQQALDAGHWYGETWLRDDDDLRSLQGELRFEALVEAFSARQREAQAAAKPQLAVLPPRTGAEPHPLLLALHGAGARWKARCCTGFRRVNRDAGWLCHSRRRSAGRPHSAGMIER